jgi:hypothetical protein
LRLTEGAHQDDIDALNAFDPKVLESHYGAHRGPIVTAYAVAVEAILEYQRTAKTLEDLRVASSTIRNALTRLIAVGHECGAGTYREKGGNEG